MKYIPSLLAVLLVTFVIGVAGSNAVAQSPLADAKSAGYLGEQPNGYLGVVNPNAPETTKMLAKEINMKRREKYMSIARSNGSTLTAVEAVVGAKLIARTPAGQFVKSAGGAWMKK